MCKTILILCYLILSLNTTNAQAGVLEAIKAGVVKVIKAIDLKIQRLQNETIWLQNAQKTVENALSKAKLEEIADWVEKQRTLYADYFDELQQVRSVILYYHRVKEITEMQIRIVQEYRKMYDLFKQDEHFTLPEIEYMDKVYAGILQKSIDNMDQVQLVVNAFTVSMTDAERMQIINGAAEAVEANYADLRLFNQENKVLSLQRSKDAREINVVKRLYGL